LVEEIDIEPLLIPLTTVILVRLSVTHPSSSSLSPRFPAPPGLAPAAPARGLPRPALYLRLVLRPRRPSFTATAHRPPRGRAPPELLRRPRSARAARAPPTAALCRAARALRGCAPSAPLELRRGGRAQPELVGGRTRKKRGVTEMNGSELVRWFWPSKLILHIKRIFAHGNNSAHTFANQMKKGSIPFRSPTKHASSALLLPDCNVPPPRGQARLHLAAF